MKRYDSYKPSGIPWIGEIPSHWETIRIKYLFNEEDEKNNDLSFQLLTFSRKKGIIPFTDANDKEPSASDLSHYKVIHPDQLLENRMQAWSGMFAKSEIEGCVSPDYSVFSKKDHSVNVDYFAHLFRTNKYISHWVNLSKGVGDGFNRLYTNQFFSVKALNPAIEEQEKIVEFLSDKTKLIDEQQKNIDKEIQYLQELKQAEIANAITKGLNPDVPMKDSGIPWIGQIPEHWKTPKFYQLFDFIGGNGFPIRLQGKTNEKYPFYKTSDINGPEIYIERSTNYVSEEDIKKENFNVIPSGAFLMSKIGAALKKNHRKITTRSSVIDNNLQALVRKPNTIADELYLYYFLKFFNMAWVDNGGTIPCVDNGLLRISKFLIPPMEEQKAIVEYVKQKNKGINDMISNLKSQKDFLTEYKQRLISDAVTGQIDVRDFKSPASAQ